MSVGDLNMLLKRFSSLSYGRAAVQDMERTFTGYGSCSYYAGIIGPQP